MENKKTLWIIAAVGAFLLVVLGAALILYTPANKNQNTFASVTSSGQYNQSGWTSAPDYGTLSAPIDSTYIESVKKDDLYVITENTNVYELPNSSSATIDLNTLKTAPASEQTQNINVTVTFADQTIPVEIVNSAEPKAAPSVREIQPKPVKKVEKTSSPVTVKKPEPKKTAAVPSPKPITVTKYWVQVAAYSNKKGAEGARSVLTANKIEADIFTYKDNKDTLYYRVRVGPYTTKSEAEYWRQKINGISEFSKAQSYVTATEN